MIHDILPSSNSAPMSCHVTVADCRAEAFKPRKRGLAHIIRDVAGQMPPVFTAMDLFAVLLERNLCGTDDLQKVKWALKYLAATGQVNTAEPGSPGQFGRVPKYAFGDVPDAPPNDEEEILEDILGLAKNLFAKGRPAITEALPQFRVENPRQPEPRRVEGISRLNHNVPRLPVIEKKLEDLRGELATAVLAHAMTDQSELIAELQSQIAMWERKEKLARMGEGQG